MVRIRTNEHRVIPEGSQVFVVASCQSLRVLPGEGTKMSSNATEVRHAAEEHVDHGVSRVMLATSSPLQERGGLE